MFSSARIVHAVALLVSVPATVLSQQSAPPPQAQPPSGHVVFSRSMDENGNTTTTQSQPGPANGQMVAAPTATDAEREAATITDFDLDVRLRPASHQIAARAQITVRNDGKTPLAHIPLQLSSQLNWERIRLDAKDTSFQVAVLNSDADHTGQLHEAAVPLATPLAPGGSLQLDATYSGAIGENAQRLLAIGTPQDVAVHSDWDRIDTGFTGLRGFGNVVWYPVSSVPVILGDGARLFDEMGTHKLHLSGAQFRLRLTVEFPQNQAPTIALVNGHPVPLNITPAGGDADILSVATADTGATTLGFEAPSLFVASRKAHQGANLTAWTTPDNDVNVQFWTDAATDVTPFLQGWLGQRPRAQLTLLDLPDPEDAPCETGALLVTRLRDGDAEQLKGVLAHALTHAWMQSPRAWLSEGVAHFMGTLWVEKQQGREKALSALEAGRQALALVEPESPGAGAGQPLDQAISPVYYRTKATYVLWMLRDIAGDPTLSAALRAYDPSKDLGNTHRSQFETLLEQAGTRHDLSWFFADWVDADKGLPDLEVENAFPTAAESGNWIVAVNLANGSYAQTEVPVTVRNDGASVTQRVRVPARGKAVQRILIQGKPAEVQVNDGTVPESQASVHVTKLENAP
ncbi:M1 family metallopeptidase [Acidobacteria bacterium AB60]|nr:M1 family metallopeptidase [Acidobacteria bacterium AB60]